MTWLVFLSGVLLGVGFILSSLSGSGRDYKPQIGCLASIFYIASLVVFVINITLLIVGSYAN